jgi:hypothetical protein
MMEFARWLFIEFFSDWFTVLTFTILFILMLIFLIDVLRYGWEVSDNEQIEDVI